VVAIKHRINIKAQVIVALETRSKNQVNLKANVKLYPV